MLRRLLAVFLALIVGVSVSVVSVVVAGSSAGAANTATEALFDDDDEAATTAVRQFAGSDRYATSVRLAYAYVAIESSTRALVVASGDSIADAAAAAGLAAVKVAPVVLTPSNRLSSSVEKFIVDEFINDVYIVGGTAAVSQAVEDTIGELATVSSVTRLAGTNRYETSVLIAREMGEPGLYCDSELETALLVNVDSSFADVIAVGPLAYELELPLLLTGADALPADVATYLDEQGIEQVVVVGGTAAVSEAVLAEVREAGVGTISRISGENRYATALAIRDELANCSAISLSPTTIALVNGEAAADGVAAGPVLGSGLDDDGVTPVLLVSTGSLPSETSGYLASTVTRNADTTFVNLRLTAIGGTAVVTNAVMSAAVAAATTSEPLTATIAAKVGATTATVTFSDQVDSAAAPAADASAALKAAFASSAMNKSNYRVGGVALIASDTVTLVGRVLTISFGTDELTQNEVISVVGNKIKGLGGDNRLVEGATFTVVPPPVDKIRPRVEIFAAPGAPAIRLRVTEVNIDSTIGRASDANDLAPTVGEKALLDAITITDAAGTIHSLHGAPTYERVAGTLTDGSAVVALHDRTSAVLFRSTPTDVTICLFGVVTSANAVDEDTTQTGDNCAPTPSTQQTITLDDTRLHVALRPGERITVAAGAFRDSAGNLSSIATATVSDFQAYPVIRRASVTTPALYDPNPLVEGDEALAGWTWAVTEADDGTDTDPDTYPDITDDSNYLTIQAKAGGIAEGAGGNAWRVAWTELPADDDDIPEAKVNLYESRKTITVDFDDDATIYTAVVALLDNDDVATNFAITSDVFTAPATAEMKIAVGASQGQRDPCRSAFYPVASNLTGICGAPEVSTTSWVLGGGQSSVKVTLNFNELLFHFAYGALITANAPADNFPLTAGWQNSATVAPRTLDLNNEFSFTIRSSTIGLADLPKPGQAISLPTGLGSTYTATNCPGLTQIDENNCGLHIEVPALRLRAAN